MQPFSIEEFLIPTIEVSVLEKIEGITFDLDRLTVKCYIWSRNIKVTGTWNSWHIFDFMKGDQCSWCHCRWPFIQGSQIWSFALVSAYLYTSYTYWKKSCIIKMHYVLFVLLYCGLLWCLWKTATWNHKSIKGIVGYNHAKIVTLRSGSCSLWMKYTFHCFDMMLEDT